MLNIGFVFNSDYYPYYIIGTVVIITSIILFLILKSPFRYPYFKQVFDISGRRNPQMEDLIDEFLIEDRFRSIEVHQVAVERWKYECKVKISKYSFLKKLREKQFLKSIDDLNAYVFYANRQQTRYQQRYYVKTSYKVSATVDRFTCSYAFLKFRNEKLKQINYENTLSKYYSANQRKLMSKELRYEIMKRDNYTCKICGKYMPDEVGLQIDHIIPINKGGKTVPSNLQVLCSKCNGSKSNKINFGQNNEL